MKIIIKFLMISFIVTILSCKERNVSFTVNSSKIYFDKYNNKKLMDSLGNQTLSKGDSTAYYQLKDIYLSTNHYDDLLKKSMVMAYKHNFAPAYLDMYYILRSIEVTKSNKKINELANYYLFISSEKGVKDANYAIIDRFGENYKVPKSSTYYEKVVMKDSIVSD